MDLFWIIVAIVVGGFIIWYLKKGKKGSVESKKPEAPSTPPETPGS